MTCACFENHWHDEKGRLQYCGCICHPGNKMRRIRND